MRSGRMVTAEESASGQSMTLPVGETLELRLPENPTTGYRWSVVENGADVLTPVEEQRGARPTALGHRRPTAGCSGPSGQGGRRSSWSTTAHGRTPPARRGGS